MSKAIYAASILFMLYAVAKMLAAQLAAKVPASVLVSGRPWPATSEAAQLAAVKACHDAGLILYGCPCSQCEGLRKAAPPVPLTDEPMRRAWEVGPRR